MFKLISRIKKQKKLITWFEIAYDGWMQKKKKKFQARCCRTSVQVDFSDRKTNYMVWDRIWWFDAITSLGLNLCFQGKFSGCLTIEKANSSRQFFSQKCNCHQNGWPASVIKKEDILLRDWKARSCIGVIVKLAPCQNVKGRNQI